MSALVIGVRCLVSGRALRYHCAREWLASALDIPRIVAMAGERKKILSYRDLTVWQRAMDLTDMAYEVSKKFPRDERFALTSQLQRSAVSVSSNIAEGHGREHLREYLHHLSIANGSLMELETQIAIALRRGYLDSSEAQRCFDLSGDVGRLLAGLVRALKARIP